MRLPIGFPLFLGLAGFGPWALAASPDLRLAAFEDAQAACRTDANALWGREVCVPMLFADPVTRTVVASQAGHGEALKLQDGVFVGRLPEQHNIANTALDWDGVRWAMIRWPLPADPATRRSLMLHESWHAIQASLGLPMRSPNPAHLASVHGRVAMRLEWRALAAALRATTPESERLAIADALAARAWRRRLGDDAGALENQLELNEGLAQFTGEQLSGRKNLDAWLATDLRRREADASFVRSFAYGSGPAYGRLLERHAPGWRQRLDADADLGALLAQALGLDAPSARPDLPDVTATRLGLAGVLAEEEAIALAQAETTARWRRRLVDGPTVHLPFQQMKISFDPDQVFALPPQGTVYPVLRVVDAWGVLEAADGALIGDHWGGVTLPGPATRDGDRWQGPGWTLALAEGWQLDDEGPQQSLRKR